MQCENVLKSLKIWVTNRGTDALRNLHATYYYISHLLKQYVAGIILSAIAHCFLF